MGRYRKTIMELRMFEQIWGYFSGAKEGKEIAFDWPDDSAGKIPPKQIANLCKRMEVNDYIICPNRRQSSRIFSWHRRNTDNQLITRSVISRGKESIKVWRVR